MDKPPTAAPARPAFPQSLTGVYVACTCRSRVVDEAAKARASAVLIRTLLPGASEEVEPIESGTREGRPQQPLEVSLFGRAHRMATACTACGSEFVIVGEDQYPTTLQACAAANLARSVVGRCEPCNRDRPIRFGAKCGQCKAFATVLLQLRDNASDTPCVACGEVKSNDQRQPEPHVVFPCGHTLCVECFVFYATMMTSEKRLHLSADQYWTFGCPSNCAASSVDPNMVALAGRAVFSKYKLFAAQMLIEADKSFVWCPCGAAFQPARRGPLTCPECKLTLCTTCHAAQHDGMCRSEASERSAEWIRANTMACGNCGRPVNKSAGCNHMTCHCGHQFCYLDGGTWGPEHFDHQFGSGGGTCTLL